MNSLVSATERPATIPLSRRLKITLGVAGLGALAGGVAGGISAAVVSAVLARDARVLFDWFPYAIGAEIGGPLGIVLLPIGAWTLMRHVPFGRAVVGTIAGTLIGGFAGYFIAPDVHALFRSIAGGVLGFGVAAIVLRLRARAAKKIRALDTERASRFT